jgi:hypothetical protein
MNKPTVQELLQMVDQAIAYNAKDAEDFESNVHLQAEMSCVAENAGILATALRERLVGEQKEERSFINSRITYKGFGYGMGSQWGIDSLQQAINKRGDN